MTIIEIIKEEDGFCEVWVLRSDFQSGFFRKGFLSDVERKEFGDIQASCNSHMKNIHPPNPH